MSKKIKKILIILLMILVFIHASAIYASTLDLEKIVSQREYSDEFVKWSKLPEGERKNTLMPRIFKAEEKQNNSLFRTNPLKALKLMKASLASSFTLRNQIPKNTTIKYQGSTNSCWAFSSISALETNLALKNYKETSREDKIYDFSERHMDYATARNAFNLGKINNYGYTRSLSGGGNFYHARSYLTNGSGAISEENFSIEDYPNMSNIDISNISGHKIETTVKDIKEFSYFEDITPDNRAKLVQEIKSHISEYGAVAASIYWYGNIDCEYYNNITSALYCNDDDKGIDHAVTIIGWDDTFPKENFMQNSQPTSNGAWIIKNSWGERLEKNINSIKSSIYNKYPETYKQLGYESYNDLPTDVIINALKQVYGENKVELSDDRKTVYITLGDKGYMYISYEDNHLYKSPLFAIKNAIDYKDYDNIYQHDELEAVNDMYFDPKKVNFDRLYLASVYSRNKDESEYIKSVSVKACDGGNYEVYINPSDSDKSLEKLKKVELKAGESANIESGYHVLELKYPVKLTGTSFVVAISTDEKVMMLESRIKDDEGNLIEAWKNAIINEGESFCSTDETIKYNVWSDLGSLQILPEGKRGNNTIKAFTNYITLSEIAVKEPPKKVEYIQGKDTIDLSGGKLELKFSDNSTYIVDMDEINLEVSGFDNTSLGIKTITLKYDNKQATFNVNIISEEQNSNENYDDNNSGNQDQNQNQNGNDDGNNSGNQNQNQNQNGNDDDNNSGNQDQNQNGNDDDNNSGNQDQNQNQNGNDDDNNSGNQDQNQNQNENDDGDNSGNQGQKQNQNQNENDEDNNSENQEKPSKPNDNEENDKNIEISSDLRNIKAEITDFEFSIEDENSTLKIEVTGLTGLNEQAKYTYYYYLSNKENAKISKWIKTNKLKKNNDGTYTIEIEIDEKTAEEFSEIEDSDEMYLYLREIATLDEIKRDQTSKGVKVTTSDEVQKKIEAMLQEIVEEMAKAFGQNPVKSESSEKYDDTTADKSIPQTGRTALFIVGLLTFIGAGSVSIYKYKMMHF